MKTIGKTFRIATAFFLVFALLCGVLYTLTITGVAQAIFPHKANGSIIEINGKKYGSELLAQQYTDDKHMWGRIMNIDTKTFKDETGNKLMYASPSNLSPASDKYKKLVAKRVKMIKAAHPDKKDTPIPVDLVTCSGSGLDPHISVAAARYQMQRIAKNNNCSVMEIQSIVDKYTEGRTFGIFGEPRVNVLKVNLALDGILK